MKKTKITVSGIGKNCKTIAEEVDELVEKYDNRSRFQRLKDWLYRLFHRKRHTDIFTTDPPYNLAKKYFINQKYAGVLTYDLPATYEEKVFRPTKKFIEEFYDPITPDMREIIRAPRYGMKLGFAGQRPHGKPFYVDLEVIGEKNQKKSFKGVVDLSKVDKEKPFTFTKPYNYVPHLSDIVKFSRCPKSIDFSNVNVDSDDSVNISEEISFMSSGLMKNFLITKDKEEE